MEPLTDAAPDAGARPQVAALFEAHALGLVRLAKVMLGDQSLAEDVVQDARSWPHSASCPAASARPSSCATTPASPRNSTGPAF